MDVKKLFITEETTILQAMQRIDELAKRIVYITEGNYLLASLSDGDIRRWILSKGSLDAPVCKAANYHPLVVRNANEEYARKFMRAKEILSVPVVNDRNEVVNVYFEDSAARVENHQLDGVPVVIMAGGKGTRLYPYTKILPKPLIPVGDEPIIEHIMKSFHHFGCNDFHLIVNHKKNMIKAYFNESNTPYNVMYADEDQPLGTGGGLSLLKGKIDDTFILSNCDILIRDDIAAMYEYHKKHGNLITMVCSVNDFTIPYGIVDIDEHGEIIQMREKPSLSFLTNTGCYIVEPEVIAEMECNQVIGFPDIIERYKRLGKRVGVYPISENSWLDMGQLDELRKMEIALTEEKE